MFTETQSSLIDNRTMPDWAYEFDLLGNLVLKHELPDGEYRPGDKRVAL